MNSSPTSSSPGILLSLLKGAGQLFFVLMLSFFMLLLESLSVGAFHSFNVACVTQKTLLSKQTSLLPYDLNTVKIVFDMRKWLESKVSSFSKELSKFKCQLPFSPSSLFYVQKKITALTKGKSGFLNFECILTSCIQLLMIRVVSFVLSLPLLIVFILAAFMDGLVKRDIRKFNAARESSFLFHKTKSYLKPVFLSATFLFFSWPWAIAPVFGLLPGMVLVAVLAWLASTQFKKYI